MTIWRTLLRLLAPPPPPIPTTPVVLLVRENGSAWKEVGVYSEPDVDDITNEYAARRCFATGEAMHFEFKWRPVVRQ